MIYLNTGFFKPFSILISIVILPIAIASAISIFVVFGVIRFFLTLVIFLSYLIILYVIYRYSKSKKYFLCTEDNFIRIKYPNLSGKLQEIKIADGDIILFEYYKISSFKSWCMLYNFVCPQCVYISFIHDGKEMCMHIGYPNYNKISELCKRKKFKLIVK